MGLHREMRAMFAAVGAAGDVFTRPRIRAPRVRARPPPMGVVGAQATSKRARSGRIGLENASGPLHNKGRLARGGHGLGHMGNVGYMEISSEGLLLTVSE